MKEIFDAFSVMVYDFKGTVKDYAGDAVFAYWDHYNVTRSEQAILACRTDLKQAQAFEDIKTSLLYTNPAVKYFRMGWGITTGNVNMSHYGVKATDLALVGDCTNLAFRLSEIANNNLPYEIIICSQTANLIKNKLQNTNLDGYAIKGRSRREHIFGRRT